MKAITAKKETKTESASSGTKASTSKVPEKKPIKPEEPVETSAKPQIKGKRAPAKLDWSKAKTKESTKAESGASETTKPALRKEEALRPSERVTTHFQDCCQN